MSLATFATNYRLDNIKNRSAAFISEFDKYIHARRKPACLRLSKFAGIDTNEYYYRFLILFVPYRNETELLLPDEHPRDAYRRLRSQFCPQSIERLRFAEEVDKAFTRVVLWEAESSIDIAAKVAPNITSGDDGQLPLDFEWLQKTLD